MSKILISYFSASGVTKRVAEKIASSLNADLFAIEPKNKYTSEDVDWINKQSRSSLEMADRSSRPAILNKIENISNYGTVVIGFPVWWDTAPTIINTFIEENDLKTKKIYVFVTSGGSSEAGSFKNLQEKYPDLDFISARRFNGYESNNEYISWLNK